MGNSAQEPLSLDAAFEILSHGERRHFLTVVFSSDGPISVSDAARKVVERRTDDRTPPGPTEVERVSVSISHVHLPRLREADILQFDSEDRTVCPGDRTEMVQFLLSAVPDEHGGLPQQ